MDKSKTYRQSKRSPVKIQYGKGAVVGKLAEDQISFVKNVRARSQIAEKMHFLNIYRAQDVYGLVSDGLIGLSPKANPRQPSDIFVHELYQQNVVGTSMFAFYLGYKDKNSEQKSMAWFGGYSTNWIKKNLKPYRNKSSEEIHDMIRYLPITSDYYW